MKDISQFRPIEVNSEFFDRVKVRVTPVGKPEIDRGWYGNTITMLGRVRHVGIVAFAFGVRKKDSKGQIIWCSSIPSKWPPSGSDRMNIVNDVKNIVNHFLLKNPDAGISPKVPGSAEDLGTFYEMRSVPQAAIKNTHIKSKGKKPNKGQDYLPPHRQGIKISASGVDPL